MRVVEGLPGAATVTRAGSAVLELADGLADAAMAEIGAFVREVAGT